MDALKLEVKQDIQSANRVENSVGPLSYLPVTLRLYVAVVQKMCCFPHAAFFFPISGLFCKEEEEEVMGSAASSSLPPVFVLNASQFLCEIPQRSMSVFIRTFDIRFLSIITL